MAQPNEKQPRLWRSRHLLRCGRRPEPYHAVTISFPQLAYEASVRLGEIQKAKAVFVLLAHTHCQPTTSVRHDVATTSQDLFKLTLLLAYSNRFLGSCGDLGYGKRDGSEPYASSHENLHLTSDPKRQGAEMVHCRDNVEQAQVRHGSKWLN